jgi:3-hydroxyisobutyrate dehydrogenase-like beta-hydroxyacid dehydrogenase
VAIETEVELSIAVIGLGQMGRGMAARLAACRFELRVWNRSRDKAAGLRATVCDSPADAARGATLVLTSLSADPAVREVVLGRDGVLDGLGEDAVHVGASTISYELLGEVKALGEKGGIAPGRVVDLLTGTLFGCPAVEGYGRRIAAGSFEPAGFRMALGLKDVELALAAGDNLRVPLPAASVVRDHMLAALARGLEHLDWSGLATVARAEAGLGPPL